MVSSRTQSKSPLPQEIINLIVDHLAVVQQSKQESVDALRACSLVSKSLHYPSRRYLFSEIEFIANSFAQQRAARLVRTLKHKSNRDLVSNVRSVTFVLDIPETLMQLRYRPYKKGFQGLFSKHQWRQKVLGFKKKFGLLESSVLTLLDILNHSKLEHFSFVAQSHCLDWGIGNPVTVPAFLQVFSNPNLDSLRLVNVVNMPESVITDAFFSTTLRDLTICNLTTMRSIGTPPAFPNGTTTRTLAKLVRLDMRRVSYTGLFSILLPFLPSSSSSPYSSIRFAHLKTFMASITNRSIDMDALWEFILGVAPSLETLALEHHGWPGTRGF